MSSPLPKLYSRHLLITIAIIILSLLSTIPTFAQSSSIRGALDSGDPYMPAQGYCEENEYTRYQEHGTFTVPVDGFYSISVDDYDLGGDYFHTIIAYIATEVSMDSTVGYWRVDETSDPTSAPANLVVGQTYYIFTADCSRLNLYSGEHIYYEMSISGPGEIERQPHIELSRNTDEYIAVLGENSLYIEYSAQDDTDVSVGFQIWDKDGNPIPLPDNMVRIIDHGGWGSITFRPDSDDIQRSPLSVTVTALSAEDEVTTETFTVLVSPHTRVFNGRLSSFYQFNETTPPVCDAENLRYRHHGTLTTHHPTLHQLYLSSFGYMRSTSKPSMALLITTDPDDLSTAVGWTYAVGTDISTVYANLMPDETYHIIAIDCGQVYDGTYDDALYYVAVYKPTLEVEAPVIEPISDQTVRMGETWSLDANVTDDNLASIDFQVWDKDGNQLTLPSSFYTVLDIDTIIFSPDAGASDNSPYTVRVSALDSDNVMSTETFTLTVPVDTYTGALDNADAIIDETFCDTSNTRYQSHGSFVASEDGLYSLRLDDIDYRGDTGDEPSLNIIITEAETDHRIVLGYTEDIDGEASVYYADLDAGKTYFISATDCADIDNNVYLSVSYEFALLGPADNASAPVLNPIDTQTVIEGNSFNLDIDIDNDDEVSFMTYIFDKDGNTVDRDGYFYSQTDNGNGTGVVTFSPQMGDAANSPYQVIIQMIDDNNIISIDSFNLNIEGEGEQSFFGILNTYDPELDYGAGIIHYQSLGSFTATDNGLYTLMLDDIAYGAVRGDTCFRVIITPERLDLATRLGWVQDEATSITSVHANLIAGETYYVTAVDCGDIQARTYLSASFEVTLAGPYDNADAPIIDPIADQTMVEKTSLTIEATVTDDDIASLDYLVLDNEGRDLNEYSDFYTDDGMGTITFTPERENVDKSPYTITLFATDDSNIRTAETFTLTVESDGSQIFTGYINPYNAFIPAQGYCGTSGYIRYRSHGTFTVDTSGAYDIIVDDYNPYEGDTTPSFYAFIGTELRMDSIIGYWQDSQSVGTSQSAANLIAGETYHVFTSDCGAIGKEDYFGVSYTMFVIGTGHVERHPYIIPIQERIAFAGGRDGFEWSVEDDDDVSFDFQVVNNEGTIIYSGTRLYSTQEVVSGRVVLMDFNLQESDIDHSPFSVTMTATDTDNNVSQETYELYVASQDAPRFSDTSFNHSMTEDTTDICGTGNPVPYRVQQSFVANTSGLYSVGFYDVGIYGGSEPPQIAVLITTDQNDLSSAVGSALLINNEIDRVWAELIEGETYYLIETNCGIMGAYQFSAALIGPYIDPNLPHIDPIDDLTLLEGENQVINIYGSDNDGMTISYEVKDKDGNIVPATDLLYAAFDNGDDTGSMTFTPQPGDSVASPYTVTVTATDRDNNVRTEPFTLSVFIQTASGQLDATDPYIEYQSSYLRYRSHGSFTAQIDGLYTLTLNNVAFGGRQVPACFRAVITPNESNLLTHLGAAIMRDDAQETFQANLVAGETYHIYAQDCRNIEIGSYISVTYDFVLTGPEDNSAAPIITPIDNQLVITDTTRTLNTSVTDDNIEIVRSLVLDKNGNRIPDTGDFYTFEYDNGTATLSFAPESSEAEGSPYLVSIAAYDQTNIVTTEMFTLETPLPDTLAIEAIPDQTMLELTTLIVDVNVLHDNPSITLGYEVRDKDNNLVPVSDPLYTTVDNGDGTGAITFTPQNDDALSAPYTVSVAARDSDNDDATETFILDVEANGTQSYTGTISDDNHFIPSHGLCEPSDYTRYQPHGTFKVGENGTYGVTIDDYTLTSGSTPFIAAYIATDLSMDSIIGYWQENAFGTSELSANLSVGETYYIFTVDCNAIGLDTYESVEYTLTVYGLGPVIRVPHIVPIYDYNMLEGGVGYVYIYIEDDNDSHSFDVEVRDNQGTIVPPSDPFYELYHRQVGDYLNFEGEIGLTARSPFQINITVTDPDGNATSESFKVYVNRDDAPRFRETIDASASFNTTDICGDEMTRYLHNTSFVAPADGLYTLSLSIRHIEYTNASSQPQLAALITDTETNLNSPLAWVLVNGTEKQFGWANLVAGETYYISGVDCGNIAQGIYDSVEYSPILFGPTDLDTDTQAPPVFSAVADVILGATASQVIEVTANDINGDDIALSMATVPNFASFVDNGDGTGELTLSPADGQEGDYTVTLQASDEDGSTSIDIPVTVTPNQKPVFVPIDDLTVLAGENVQIPVEATDPEGQPVSYRLLGIANQHDFITLVGDTLTINPTANDGGTYRIIIEASDGFETKWEAFNLTVDTGENLKPVFDPIANVTLLPNEQEMVTVNATDPEGQPISYRVIGSLPNFITWDTDTFTIAPSVGDEGSYRITVEASDGVERRWARFTVTVGAAENQKPVFEQVGDYWIAAGNTAFLPIVARDPEGLPLTFRVIGGANNLPDFMRWNPAVPRFRIAPQAGDNGTYTIRVEASDGVERRWMTFRVRVVNPPN